MKDLSGILVGLCSHSWEPVGEGICEQAALEPLSVCKLVLTPELTVRGMGVGAGAQEVGENLAPNPSVPLQISGGP